jgi:hypothetical protein
MTTNSHKEFKRAYYKFTVCLNSLHVYLFYLLGYTSEPDRVPYKSLVITNESLVTTNGSLVITNELLVVTNELLVVTNGSLVTTNGSLVTTNESLVITNRGERYGKE